MSKQRERSLREELNKDLKLLKEHYHPQKIILFGSLTSGTIHDWSDLDLVIVKETNRSFYERIEDVLTLLQPKVGIDLLVYTPKEYEEMKNRIFFKTEVLNKGKVLYEGR